MIDPTGPHLAAAVICERVIQEQDGGTTAIRVIDRVTFVSHEGSERLPQPIWFLIKLTSGAARGVFFEGEDRGVNVVLNALFAPAEAGLYWYDVFYGADRLTRIPLRAIFQTRAAPE